jgi:hypothetical protein
MSMLKNCLVILVFWLIGCRLSAQVGVSRLVPAGLATDRYWVSVGCMDSGALSKLFSFVARSVISALFFR